MDHFDGPEEELWLETQTFKTQQGQHVCFLRASDGEWKASIAEEIGGCSRTKVLPVFCHRHGDVSATFRALRGELGKHAHKWIHVLRRRMNSSSENNHFVYLGEQQLKGGYPDPSSSFEPSEASSSSQAVAAGNSARTIQVAQQQCAPIALKDIASIKDLVKALNECPGTEDQEKLLACVRECKNEFDVQRIGHWTEEEGYALREYSILGGIRLQDRTDLVLFHDEKKTLLKEIFSTLIRKISPDELDQSTLIEAIGLFLCKVDKAVFEENPGWLLRVAKKLLRRLDPKDNRYVQTHYAEQCSTFCALHMTLVISGQIDSEKWSIEKERRLFDDFRMGLKNIRESARYYPVRFHVSVLEQILIRLTSGVDSRDVFRRVGHLLGAVADVCQVAYSLTIAKTLILGILGLVSKLDKPESLVKHYKGLTSSESIKKQPCYQKIIDLNSDYIDPNGSSDTNEDSTLENCLKEIEDEEKTMKNGDNRIAFRFSFTQQLCKIVLAHTSCQLRKKCLSKLKFYLTEWQEDYQVLEELLESLIRIKEHCQFKDEKRLAAEAALESLRKTQNMNVIWCHEFFDKQTELVGQVREVRDIVTKWEEKLPVQEKGQDDTNSRSDPTNKWYSIISKCLGGAAAEDADVNASKLKIYYAADTFTTIPSFIDDVKEKHAKEIEFWLKAIERKNRARLKSAAQRFVDKFQQ